MVNGKPAPEHVTTLLLTNVARGSDPAGDRSSASAPVTFTDDHTTDSDQADQPGREGETPRTP